MAAPTDPEALYDEGVRYAYDATHAPSLELTQRYYAKAARLFEQAARHLRPDSYVS